MNVINNRINQLGGFPISLEILKLKTINITEKAILAGINLIDDGDGCSPSNKEIAEAMQVSESTASNAISKLKKLKLIYQSNFDGRIRTIHIVKEGGYEK